VRKLFFSVIAAALLTPAVAGAQTYPAKPLRLIIPFGPGGTNDILGRLVALRLGEALGQQIIPDNRGGAGGSIGMEVAAKSPPDGYTIAIGHIGTLAVNKTLYSRLGYDPVKSFDHITMISKLPNLMAVNPTVPVKSVKEFIALAKARPGKLTYGSGGTGGAGHLATEYLKLMTKTDMVHVPYRSTGLAVIDTVGGQTDMVFAGVPAIVPHTRTGRLRALGLSGTARLAVLPDIPTISETVPGYEATQWYGIVAPAGTPKPALNTLHAGLVKVVNHPAFRESLAADGAEPITTSPEEFTAFIRKEIPRWAPVIQKAGLVQ
jgi:tripartite-type tricarboxylate transporter receptor subunit TctC